MKPATSRFFCPRLSEATRLLPLIRSHLVAVASECPLGTALDLVPIAEDGLFGYELVPDGEAHTYLIALHRSFASGSLGPVHPVLWTPERSATGFWADGI